jgi:hypothetical protein
MAKYDALSGTEFTIYFAPNNLFLFPLYIYGHLDYSTDQYLIYIKRHAFIAFVESEYAFVFSLDPLRAPRSSTNSG